MIHCMYCWCINLSLFVLLCLECPFCMRCFTSFISFTSFAFFPNIIQTNQQPVIPTNLRILSHTLSSLFLKSFLILFHHYSLNEMVRCAFLSLFIFNKLGLTIQRMIFLLISTLKCKAHMVMNTRRTQIRLSTVLVPLSYTACSWNNMCTFYLLGYICVFL